MPKIIENLEARLIAEARKQILDQGYGTTTVRSVAMGCGVAVGTVYNYFPSKDALVAGFLLEDWKVRLADIEFVSREATDPESVARSIYAHLTGFTREYDVLFRDRDAAESFAGAFRRYHILLRDQLAKPLEKFTADPFASRFIAEALLCWTMAGADFNEIYGMIRKLF